MKCHQYKCGRAGRHLFTWPGGERKAICEAHLPKLRAVAASLDVDLYLEAIASTDACPACDAQWPTIAIEDVGDALSKGVTVSVVLSITCAACGAVFASCLAPLKVGGYE